MAKKDLVKLIMDYESGTLRGNKVLELFGYLIKNKMAWNLQGSYGKMAGNLIDRGYISGAGIILKVV